MNTNTKIFFLLILLFSLSQAQNFSVFNKAADELENRIEYLKQTADRYQVNRANEYLNQASGKLEEAHSLLRQIPPRVNAAWAAYRQAKALTDQAAKILLIKPALRAGAEMDRLLLQAESLVQNSNNAEARYMLTRARSFRFKSETAFRNSRFVKAREYYRIALFFVNKSIKLAKGATGNNSGQSYEQLLEDITNLYGDLSTAAGSDAALNTLLQKAQNALRLAQKANEQGRRRQALLQLQICERLLYRAADLSQQKGQGRTEQINSNLMSLERYILGIEADIQNKNNRQSLRLLRKAKDFLRAARHDYENNAYKQAESKIALAQRMAAKALRLSDQDTPVALEDIERRINEIRHLIELQQQKTVNKQGRLMRLFHRQAEHLLDSAENDLQSGDSQIAFQKTKTALHLINRLESVLSNPKTNGQTASQLQERLQQAKRAIQVLEKNTYTSPGSAVLLPLLRTLSEKVRIAIDRGDFLTAGETLNFIQGRINSLMKSEAH